jgi:hypothetical protein
MIELICDDFYIDIRELILILHNEKEIDSQAYSILLRNDNWLHLNDKQGKYLIKHLQRFYPNCLI